MPAWRWISGSSASGMCGPLATWPGKARDQDGAQTGVCGQEPGSAASAQGVCPEAVGGHLALVKPLRLVLLEVEALSADAWPVPRPWIRPAARTGR